MFKRILVPTDGSKLSQKAVKEAIELAKENNASVTALHVYPKFAGSPYGTFGPAEDVLEEAHKNQARAEGESIFNSMSKLADGVSVDSVLVESDDDTHFQAVIVAPEFAGKRSIQRHQLVYAALGTHMGREIHALSIQAYTPEEWQASGAAGAG